MAVDMSGTRNNLRSLHKLVYRPEHFITLYEISYEDATFYN
jgi:hypothetical protein